MSNMDETIQNNSEEPVQPLPLMATPLSPHEEDVRKRNQRSADAETNRERRLLRVDQLIREYNLQVPITSRLKLKPLDYVTQVKTLEEALGNVKAIVTDGLLCWILVADDRIEIVHYDNLVHKQAPKQTEQNEETKAQKASLRQDIQALKHELKQMDFAYSIQRQLFDRHIISKQAFDEMTAKIANHRIKLREQEMLLENLQQ